MRLHHHAKHWLIPHKHNNHRPHLIRGHGLALMLGLLVVVQAAAYLSLPVAARSAGVAGQVLAYATNITVTDLFNQTNQQRVNGGMAPLQLSSVLNQGAVLKAQNMFQEDYWAHDSPSGLAPWHWFDQVGYAYKNAGENLAKDFATTAGAVTGWMNSPGHRANLMSADYTQVGFAVVNGTLQNNQTTLVVAHYGRPLAASASPTVSAPQAPPAAAAAARPAAPAPAATPVPTLAAEPLATPGPSPVVTATPAPAVSTQSGIKVSASGEVTSAPAAKNYSLFQPISVVRSLGWGTLATVGLLTLLLMVYLHTHVTVWRKGLVRWHRGHYRWLATAQVSSLAVAILALVASGFGQVG